MEPSNTERLAWDILRDPAVWAWVVVALLAILPARAALAQDRVARAPGHEPAGHVTSDHAVAPGGISSPRLAFDRTPRPAARPDR